MSVSRATYLDSSAIVKLATSEPESKALRRYLLRKRPLVASALARVEVARALLPFGSGAVARAEDVLRRLDVVRVNDLARVCTYDERMATAGPRSASPSSHRPEAAS